MADRSVLTGLRVRSLAAISALGIGIVLLLSSASPAAAWTTGFTGFCSGVVLGNHAACNANSHDSQGGYPTEVNGVGFQHSVCVEAWKLDGIKMCSGGPGQGVYNSTPSGTGITIPTIYNNAVGANEVYGSAFYCVTPGC